MSTKTPMLRFHFYALSRAERFVMVSKDAKDERAARRKVRASKYGRSLRSVKLDRIETLKA